MYVQFFAYKMTVASENLMLKHRNIDLNTVSLKANDCTVYFFIHSILALTYLAYYIHAIIIIYTTILIFMKGKQYYNIK
jgi:hypothetical protein